MKLIEGNWKNGIIITVNYEIKIKKEWNDMRQLIIIFFLKIKSHSFHSLNQTNFIELISWHLIYKIKWNGVSEDESIITVS